MKTFIDTGDEQAGASGLQRFTLSGPTMGTRYSAVFHARENIDIDGLGAGLLEAVELVDRQMSSWKVGSDLCRLNAAVPGEWVELPEALFSVLEAALSIGRASNGAFDISVGDIVEAWGFGPSGNDPRPDEIARAASETRVSVLDGLDLDRARYRVRKAAPYVFDLAGIAKGFGVDQMAKVMVEQAIPSWLVGIDGEMRASGVKPGGRPWSVAIEEPVAGIRQARGVVELADMAIATSGDYRHFVELDGREFAHTISPQKRAPLANSLASVTVIATSCMLADAWATALMVLGENTGPKTARMLGINALFMLRQGDDLGEIAIGPYFG